MAAAEQAQKDAAEKASRYQVAQADLVRQAALVTQVNQRIARAGGTKFAQEVNVAAAAPVLAPVAAAARPAAGSTTLNWRLKVRCGDRDVAVSGPAVFSIERNGEGVVVSERFTGSGDGFEVLVTGRASFDRPQPSYEIPTTGEWKGPRTFSSQGIDRANTRDGQGLAVVSGNVLKFRANCPDRLCDNRGFCQEKEPVTHILQSLPVGERVASRSPAAWTPAPRCTGCAPRAPSPAPTPPTWASPTRATTTRSRARRRPTAPTSRA